MPGIHCLYSLSEISPELLKKSHEGLMFRDCYELSGVHKHKNCDITISNYPGYPFLLKQVAGYKITLEGIIYNQSNNWILNSLHSVCESYLAGEDYINKIADFIENCDGEYLVAIFLIKQKI